MSAGTVCWGLRFDAAGRMLGYAPPLQSETEERTMLATTKSAPRAVNAGATAQEIAAPMQTESYALIDSVVQRVQALQKNQALFLPCNEMVVARSSTGKLRIGHAPTQTWWGADAVDQIRETLTALLDRKRGHFATNLRRELEGRLWDNVQTVENVGRRTFHIVYEPSERAWLAFHSLDCDHVDWVGRPYGAMDCICSDGRHLFITGGGEIRERAVA